jgi:hypothetical protein
MSDAEAPDQSVIEITAIRWFTRRLRLSSFAFLKKAALESKLQPKKSVERDSSCRIYPSIRKCTRRHVTINIIVTLFDKYAFLYIRFVYCLAPS